MIDCQIIRDGKIEGEVRTDRRGSKDKRPYLQRQPWDRTEQPHRIECNGSFAQGVALPEVWHYEPTLFWQGEQHQVYRAARGQTSPALLHANLWRQHERSIRRSW